MLIYNGNDDSVCEFVSNEWFVEELAKRQELELVGKRHQWFYRKAAKFVSGNAGFYQRYASANLTVDLVTVMGAGHAVPQFRPGRLRAS